MEMAPILLIYSLYHQMIISRKIFLKESRMFTKFIQLLLHQMISLNLVLLILLQMMVLP
jgi:hypothetical protein